MDENQKGSHVSKESYILEANNGCQIMTNQMQN